MQLEKKSKYVDYIIVYMTQILIIGVYLIQLICDYKKTLWNFDMALKKKNHRILMEKMQQSCT